MDSGGNGRRGEDVPKHAIRVQGEGPENVTRQGQATEERHVKEQHQTRSHA